MWRNKGGRTDMLQVILLSPDSMQVYLVMEVCKRRAMPHTDKRHSPLP